MSISAITQRPARAAAPVTSSIEGTILDKSATVQTIDELCGAARYYGWKGVCVYPEHIREVAGQLKGSPVIPVSVVGFPDGTIDTARKVADVHDAIAGGAKEVDMVINVSALKAGRNDDVKKDIEAVAEAAHAHQVPLKVILEAGVLSDEEISRGSRLAIESGADFLKRSTGFEPEEKKIKDDAVRYHQLDLMAQAIAESGWKKTSRVNSNLQMKDSGQIRTLETAQGSLAHGANRLGVGFEAALKISEAETGNNWNASKAVTSKAA